MQVISSVPLVFPQYLKKLDGGGDMVLSTYKIFVGGILCTLMKKIK